MAVVVVALVPRPALGAVTASPPLRQAVLTYDSRSTATMREGTLTADGGDRYAYRSVPGSFDASGPGSNRGENLRVAFWPAGVPVVADSESCAIWTSQLGRNTQQGAAFRIRLGGDGRLRALTVTKNILYGVNWGFNFHTWDTNQRHSYTKFGAVLADGMKGPDDRALPLPWHFCARTVGSTMEIKVWTTHMREPAWGDPRFGGKVAIPAGWEASGTTGWYVGHVPAGGWAEFDDLRTWRYQLTEPVDRPTEPTGRTAGAVSAASAGGAATTSPTTAPSALDPAPA
ncbi:hypothetical protein KSP35_21000 [Aquihabitans sp. G128]|uniref:hypothetical protein n=1 Tax=Aquihabitans sp. G128 TaxID=2849779 RepID=UPI001C230B3F|nr:hypothetical protein [Aquihabitans sp. G128]QXC60771.1 hypothetical protein KSP35_21000 [Aquihabitans sp. G128]